MLSESSDFWSPRIAQSAPSVSYSVISFISAFSVLSFQDSTHVQIPLLELTSIKTFFVDVVFKEISNQIICSYIVPSYLWHNLKLLQAVLDYFTQPQLCSFSKLVCWFNDSASISLRFACAILGSILKKFSVCEFVAISYVWPLFKLSSFGYFFE